MTHYSQVLSQVYSLSFLEKLRLLDELKSLVSQPIETDEDEIISSEKFVQSEAAWKEYLSGQDQGIRSQDLKQKLLGDNLV